MTLDPAQTEKRRPWLRAALLGGLAALGMLCLPEFVAGFLAGVQNASEPLRTPIGMPDWEFVLIWVLLSGVATIVIKRFRDAREEAARQRRFAELARDAALRTRLAPHFIFNALNILHAQIEGDPREAQATTERLAQLFRQVLENADQETISLRAELAFVEGYLGIERARLGERLRVQIDIPEELETAEIPPLSLQVLVENAVKHGIASLEAGGLVRIAAWKEDGCLVLSVTDPGNGRGEREGSGTALATLRARLKRPQDLDLSVVECGFRAAFRWGQA